MNTQAPHFDYSAVDAMRERVARLLAAPIDSALDFPDVASKAVGSLVEALDGVPVWIEIDRLPATGTRNGGVRFDFTERFYELVGALEAAYRDVGVPI